MFAYCMIFSKKLSGVIRVVKIHIHVQQDPTHYLPYQINQTNSLSLPFFLHFPAAAIVGQNTLSVSRISTF